MTTIVEALRECRSFLLAHRPDDRSPVDQQFGKMLSEVSAALAEHDAQPAAEPVAVSQCWKCGARNLDRSAPAAPQQDALVAQRDNDGNLLAFRHAAQPAAEPDAT